MTYSNKTLLVFRSATQERLIFRSDQQHWNKQELGRNLVVHRNSSKMFFPEFRNQLEITECIRIGPLITGTSIRQNKNSGIHPEQSAIIWNSVDNQELRRAGQHHRNKTSTQDVDRSRALDKSVTGSQKKWAVTRIKC